MAIDSVGRICSLIAELRKRGAVDVGPLIVHRIGEPHRTSPGAGTLERLNQPAEQARGMMSASMICLGLESLADDDLRARHRCRISARRSSCSLSRSSGRLLERIEPEGELGAPQDHAGHVGHVTHPAGRGGSRSGSLSLWSARRRWSAGCCGRTRRTEVFRLMTVLMLMMDSTFVTWLGGRSPSAASATGCR